MAISEPVAHATWMLQQIEDLTGRLYALYASYFDDTADFWTSLAREEAVHARWVQYLTVKIEQGRAHVREARFNLTVYQTFLDYLHQRLRDDAAHPPTLVQALAIAEDIEASFVEKSFFEIFEGDDAELVRTLTALAKSSAEHLGRVKALRAMESGIQDHRPTLRDG